MDQVHRLKMKRILPTLAFLFACLSALGQGIQYNRFTTNTFPPLTQTVYVDTNGSDATAVVGDQFHPAQTLTNAFQICPSGGAVVLTPGQVFGGDLTTLTKSYQPIKPVTLVAYGAVISNSVVNQLFQLYDTDFTQWGGKIYTTRNGTAGPYNLTTDTGTPNFTLNQVQVFGTTDGIKFNNSAPVNLVVNQGYYFGFWDLLRDAGSGSGSIYTFNGCYFNATNNGTSTTLRTVTALAGTWYFNNCTIIETNSSVTGWAIDAESPAVVYLDGCYVSAGTVNGGQSTNLIVGTGGVVNAFGYGQWDNAQQLNNGTINYYGQVPSSKLSGLVPTGNLASGSATSSTFLRGDQTWATPAGGGTWNGTAPIKVVTASYTVTTNDFAILYNATGPGDIITLPPSASCTNIFFISSANVAGTITITTAAATVFNGVGPSGQGWTILTNLPNGRLIVQSMGNGNGYTVFNWDTNVTVGSGTVTSVGVSAPNYLTVVSSPITTSGTIALTGNGSPGTFSSVLSTNGIIGQGLALATKVVTANYSITTNDYFINASNGTSTLTLTLPAASGISNMFEIFLGSTNTNGVVLSRAGSDTFVGFGTSTFTNTGRFETIKIQSDGTNAWSIKYLGPQRGDLCMSILTKDTTRWQLLDGTGGFPAYTNKFPIMGGGALTALPVSSITGVSASTGGATNNTATANLGVNGSIGSASQNVDNTIDMSVSVSSIGDFISGTATGTITGTPHVPPEAALWYWIHK